MAVPRFLLFIVWAGAFWSAPALAQDDPIRKIEQVRGDLYMFSEDNTNGVFLVTDEGIILADPISHDNAEWLKEQLDERFGVSVKYVIYSHDHADHTSGGEVFEDTATFVGHVYAKPRIEESGHTPPPDIRFPSRYRIELGGEEVKLYYFARSHSDNLITILFPGQSTLFLVDIVAAKRLPYRDLPDYHFPQILKYLKRVVDLDFEILVPGHGPRGDKTDVAGQRLYLEALMEAVKKGLEEGLSLEQIQATADFPLYDQWAMYDQWLQLNIAGMYRILSADDFGSEPLAIVSQEEAKYPRNAKQMGFVGWVVLNFDVSAEGLPMNITVLDADAESFTKGITDNSRALKQFKKAAIRALENTQYEKGDGREGYYRWVFYSLRRPPGDTNNPGFLDFGIHGPGAGKFGELVYRDYVAGNGNRRCC